MKNIQLTEVIKDILSEFININEQDRPLYPYGAKELYERFCDIIGDGDIYYLECTLVDNDVL